MLAVVAAILPVFLLVFLGYALRARGFLTEGFWQPAERLTYFVLFPTLIVTTLAKADLAGLTVLPMAGALIAALLIMAALLLVVRPWLGVDGPGFTSVVQGAVRMNTYVCLAIAATLWESAGLTLAAIAVAVIVPTVNVISVAMLARYGSTAVPSAAGVAARIARNPLILGCVVGIALNAGGFALPPVLGPMLEILGRAALPIGLLAVGGGLDFGAVRANAGIVGTATGLKLLIMPAMTAATLWAFGVEGVTAAVALLFNASPTATSSYILARQLGGDARLMAGIFTLQTAASMVTLPAVLTLAA